MAVSGLVIHSVPEHWPQPINDLISMFQPQLASGQVREASMLMIRIPNHVMVKVFVLFKTRSDLSLFYWSF